ncbi:MAG: FAD-dependent oxidoreductase [Lachnospiraceae bacterium]|nr:FAD-dependent oxidoreductase [Lachnospiraceae bacterium]
MIRINEIKVPEGSDTEHVKKKVAHLLRIDASEIKDLKVLKCSKDARNRSSILDVYSVSLSHKNEARIVKRAKRPNVILYSEETYRLPERRESKSSLRPVVAGFGPAGIFTALILAMAGEKPLVIERGKPVEERVGDIERFFEKGVLDPDSNAQFGEGGAGTFSDGKLSTGIKDRAGRKDFILKTLIKHGADEAILTSKHPHIGSDRLISIIPSLRRELESYGGEIRFCTALTSIDAEGGALKRICVKNDKEEWIECSDLFLCLGHSARDTVKMLYDSGLSMEAKAFAVGVRAEHARGMIDDAMGYKSASYKLTYHCRDGRGIYSFCMCPGGYVINASSEPGHLVVNGMSLSARDAANSNSAIVCTVTPSDYASYGSDPLSGIGFQRDLEKKAYEECGGSIPYQRFEDFTRNLTSESFGHIRPCCKGRYGMGNIRNILPDSISDDIIEAMSSFSGRIQGFDDGDTLFAAIESRTSSPVRILRGEDMQSVSIRGIYPAGEGAGYAGGIMSAAIDGMKAAETYISG